MRIGLLKLSKMGMMPKLIKTGMEGLNDYEIEVLMDFQSSGSKTLGQVLSSNGLMGSKVINAIEKLRDFGFIRRDWEKEIELGVDVVYSLTEFGRETARRYGEAGQTY